LQKKRKRANYFIDFSREPNTFCFACTYMRPK
jgi:hypothetical protein